MSPKSTLMASGIKGGKANHDRKATKNPTVASPAWSVTGHEERRKEGGDARQARWKLRETSEESVRIGSV